MTPNSIEDIMQYALNCVQYLGVVSMRLDPKSFEVLFSTYTTVVTMHTKYGPVKFIKGY